MRYKIKYTFLKLFYLSLLMALFFMISLPNERKVYWKQNNATNNPSKIENNDNISKDSEATSARYDMEIISENTSVLTTNNSVLAPTQILPEVDTENTLVEENRTFYVLSPSCRMPYVDPFTPELLQIFEPCAYENCTSDDDVITQTFDENLNRYILHIHSAVGQQLLEYSDDEFYCCYMEIQRDGDEGFNLLPCTNLTQDFIVPPHIDYMLVECRSVYNESMVIQKNAFAFIQYRNNDNNNNTIEEMPNVRKPSVFLIGIDSMSRINIRRSMPNTTNFLTENEWYELQGYNKIGDNTYPNLMGVLAGFNEDLANEICKPQTDGGLDRCPLIWKDFKSAGYVTAYAEDEPGMSTFNYLKNGFVNPPVDYYHRPFMKAIDSNLKAYKRWGLSYCLGRKHSAVYVYDYCMELAHRYSKEPVFGLFWTNSFSHNSFESPAAMDMQMLDYLEELKRTGVLETSIIVFFSDHGMRWGSLLDLPEGFIEERVPLLFIWLPPWFRDQYPSYAQALKENRNRLTSPYDLHLTLKHIANLSNLRVKIPAPPECPKCHSLFRPVSDNRTCEEAGITDHWCTCIPYEVINRDLGQNITNLIIDEMNDYLTKKNLSSLCNTLIYDSLDVAERRMFDSHFNSVNDVLSTVRIKFKTQPQEGSFQATTLYNKLNETVLVDVESITRLNSYENDSRCVHDKQAKKYCFCRADIQNH